jgi:hypothetical protein
MTRFTAPSKKATPGKTKSVTRTKAKVDRQEYLGLCSTCIHTETCTFRRDVSQAVLECDEFDTGKTAEAVVIEAPATAVELESAIEFKGLCVNCDIRQSCTFSKPPEGIWHCEEYV